MFTQSQLNEFCGFKAWYNSTSLSDQIIFPKNIRSILLNEIDDNLLLFITTMADEIVENIYPRWFSQIPNDYIVMMNNEIDI